MSAKAMFNKLGFKKQKNVKELLDIVNKAMGEDEGSDKQ